MSQRARLSNRRRTKSLASCRQLWPISGLASCRPAGSAPSRWSEGCGPISPASPAAGLPVAGFSLTMPASRGWWWAAVRKRAQIDGGTPPEGQGSAPSTAGAHTAEWQRRQGPTDAAPAKPVDWLQEHLLKVRHLRQLDVAAIGRHHLDQSRLQKAVERVFVEAGVTKAASCHTFCHSFAAHLL